MTAETPSGTGSPPPASDPAPAPSDAAATVRVDAATIRLGVTLQLERRARQAEPRALPFVLVNETRRLLPYRQAAFWRVARGDARLEALSGVAEVDASAPYARWLAAFGRWFVHGKRGDPDGMAALAGRALAEGAEAGGTPRFLADWASWLPEHALAVPLSGPGGEVCGLLALFRETPFADGERRLFAYLAESYGQTLGAAAMRPRRRWGGASWRRTLAAAAALAAMALLALPQPRTALAPAEVAARAPALVRAELEGVIDRLLVEPNQPVTRGTPLFRMEDAQLRTRLAVAKKAEEVLRAEVRQLQQLALADTASRARLEPAQGRLAQLAAETAYAESLLARVETASPIDGVALCDHPADWIGRPVGLGQKIMLVADPADVELEISLPVGESLRLAVGDDVRFYPNVAPASPVAARLTFIGYRAAETPGSGLCYRLRAEFVDGAPPMLGLRGTARLQGERLPLGLIILRRPLRTVRQWLGW